jgi:ABC-type sugar transport system permease subunit
MKPTKLKGLQTQAKQENIFCFCILIFFFIQWGIFWLYANLNSIRLAFSYFNTSVDEYLLLPADRFFENFADFFSLLITPRGGEFLLNGAYFHLITSVVCLPISYMVAFIIYKKLPFSGVFKVVLYLPAILSGMVVILLYRHYITALATENGFRGIFTDPSTSRWIVSLYVLFTGIPSGLLVNLGSMSRVPSELIEYGELEGISLWKEFTLITVPMIFPVLQVQCLGLFTGFFTTQGPLFTFYNRNAPDELQTFGYYMFMAVYEGVDGMSKQDMYGFTSAANLSIGLMSIPIVQGTKWLFDKFDPGAEF